MVHFFFRASPSWQEEQPGPADVYLRMDAKTADLVAAALEVVNPDEPAHEFVARAIANELRAITASYALEFEFEEE